MDDAMTYAEVGKRRPRVDARQQVTGRMEYTNDLRLPGMLYAKPVLSTEHHARIVRIDSRAAERVRGVRAVATAEDCPHNTGGFILPDQPVFAEGKVRYRGEIVALVAADTEAIAREAAQLVEVEYEPLPPVFDPRAAMEPDAPLIHEEGQGAWCRGNVVLHQGRDHMTLRHGDVEQGFAESDLVVERSFATSPQRCAPIESHACIVKPDGPDRVTVIANSQMPFSHQPLIARALGLPLNAVRIIVPPMGGGFGQKNSLTIEANVAVLALKVGRPVKWALTTEEDFRYSSTKIPTYLTYRMGCSSGGILRAVHRTHIGNAGAYGSSSILMMGKCTMVGSGPYLIPHQLAESWIVYTNKCPSAAFRGFGVSQPTFAVEIMMDIIAERLGMDPLQVRLQNVLHDGDRAGTGQVVRAVGIEACLNKVADLCGWEHSHKDPGTAT